MEFGGMATIVSLIIETTVSCITTGLDGVALSFEQEPNITIEDKNRMGRSLIFIGFF